MSKKNDDYPVIGCIVLLIAFFLIPFPFNWAWNYVAPQFGLPILHYWLTFGALFCLRVIGGALFKK